MSDSRVAPERNLVWSPSQVSRERRRARLGHGAATLWFTGLSGSGKSTLARAVELALFERGVLTCVLDGDNLRHGLCSDLGFSASDRQENIRRVAQVARLLDDAGLLTITAFISPYRSDRAAARAALGAGHFFEVHVDCPLEVCERRDTKGLYRRARAGEIQDFTGVSAPYEPPEHPELRVDTARDSVEGCVERVLAMLEAAAVIG
jgi:adenylyl-sulfate kinase